MNNPTDKILAAKEAHFQLKACYPRTIYLSPAMFATCDSLHLIDFAKSHELLGMMVQTVPDLNGSEFTFSDECLPKGQTSSTDAMLAEADAAPMVPGLLTTATCRYAAQAFQRGFMDANRDTVGVGYKTLEMVEAYNAGITVGKLAATEEVTQLATEPNHLSTAPASMENVIAAINATPERPQLTQSELLKVLGDVVCAARSEELETALRNVQHWLQHSAKLETTIVGLRARIAELEKPPASLEPALANAVRIILSERAYQKRTKLDDSHRVAEWLYMIENYKEQAGAAWFVGKEAEAMAGIRKIGALALAAIEQIPTPAREAEDVRP